MKDPSAVVICGGSDVLVKIREGKLAGCSLVSIHGIRELEGVSLEPDGTIVIGPATTFSHVTNDPLVEAHLPALGDAVDQAGGPQLRNIGTIGGNVCNGVTSADSASTLLRIVHFHSTFLYCGIFPRPRIIFSSSARSALISVCPSAAG